MARSSWIEADGNDEDEAIAALVQLDRQSGFGEEIAGGGQGGR